MPSTLVDDNNRDFIATARLNAMTHALQFAATCNGMTPEAVVAIARQFEAYYLGLPKTESE
jgi:hypothetical protein